MAEEYILKGIKILDNLKYKPFVARGFFYLGELYADMSQKEKALGILRKAEELFQQILHVVAKSADRLLTIQPREREPHLVPLEGAIVQDLVGRARKNAGMDGQDLD